MAEDAKQHKHGASTASSTNELILPHEHIISTRYNRLISAGSSIKSRSIGDEESGGGFTFKSDVFIGRVRDSRSSGSKSGSSSDRSRKVARVLDSSSVGLGTSSVQESKSGSKSSSGIGSGSKPSSEISRYYSPKTCPICMERYKAGDDIAWSHNEDCLHAFHVDCIVQWLMTHDHCPMCRSPYLGGPGSNNATVG